MKHILIFGASRGLGGALNRWLPERGDRVWLVSRSQPWLDASDGVTRYWIEADLTQLDAAQRVAEPLGGQRLDVLIYNAGIWEATAFGPGYDFEQVSAAENDRILTINLSAAIHCIQKLIPNLRRSDNGKIVLISSASGRKQSLRWRKRNISCDASRFSLTAVRRSPRLA
ncbi:MAG: SDR family NAD(P)-dependent oxidoreductase [Anaerolineales bacterium]